MSNDATRSVLPTVAATRSVLPTVAGKCDNAATTTGSGRTESRVTVVAKFANPVDLDDSLGLISTVSAVDLTKENIANDSDNDLFSDASSVSSRFVAPKNKKYAKKLTKKFDGMALQL